MVEEEEVIKSSELIFLVFFRFLDFFFFRSLVKEKLWYIYPLLRLLKRLAVGVLLVSI